MITSYPKYSFTKTINMKRLLIIVAMAVAIVSYAQESKQPACHGDSSCCNAIMCDSVNIPVFIIDGVEVQNPSDLENDDIIEVKILKDSEAGKIFSPRLGGIVLITTKSKKYLKPILEKYKAAKDKNQIKVSEGIVIR